MPVEEQARIAQRNIEKDIKLALLDRNMSQRELASLMHETPQQVNRAIKADMQPRSIEIREKIYKILGINQ